MTKTRIRKPRKMGQKKIQSAVEKFYVLWPDKRPKVEEPEDYQAISNEDIAEADFRADLQANLEEELDRRIQNDEPSLLFDGDYPNMDDFGERPIKDFNKTQAFHKAADSEEYERWNEYRNEEMRWFGLHLEATNEEMEEYTLHKHNTFKALREALEQSVLLF